MKRFALLVAAATFASATVLRADDQPRSRPAPQPGDVRAAGEERGTGRRETSADAYIETMDKEVGLTDEQKKAMAAIFESRDKSIKDFESQNADKIKTTSKAMEDAIASNDREAIGKAREDYRDVFSPMHEVMRKASEDLNNVLTAEQKAKLQQVRLEAAIKNMAGPVVLTEEQMKQLVALASGSENARGALQEKVAPALEQMLTPEQKAAMTKYRVIAEVQRGFAGARLTREQVKELEGAYDELAKDTNLKTEDLVKQLTEKGTGFLTDEQKEAIKSVSSRSAGRDR